MPRPTDENIEKANADKFVYSKHMYPVVYICTVRFIPCLYSVYFLNLQRQLFDEKHTQNAEILKHEINYFSNLSHSVCNYTVSQKTSHRWLAITLTHVNGFWYFWQKCYW